MTLNDFNKLAKRLTHSVTIISTVNPILSIKSGKLVGKRGGSPTVFRGMMWDSGRTRRYLFEANFISPNYKCDEMGTYPSSFIKGVTGGKERRSSWKR